MSVDAYKAPCLGGPMEGETLPYDYENGIAHPSHYFVMREDDADYFCGKYIFAKSSGPDGRPFHGDQWVWHPFLTSILEA